MNDANGNIYLASTAFNTIWVLDKAIHVKNYYKVNPPDPSKKVQYKKNYNHMNNVFPYNGRLYCDLNWYENKQHGFSGVAVLDKRYNELARFQYGWETHGFRIIDDRYYALCACSKRSVCHTYMSGLYVDEKLVFSHDQNIFCKDFDHTGDMIIIGGGDVGNRTTRGIGNGHIFILDNNYNVMSKRTIKGIGGIKGVRICK
jgi:hypothetical protein